MGCNEKEKIMRYIALLLILIGLSGCFTRIKEKPRVIKSLYNEDFKEKGIHNNGLFWIFTDQV